MASNLDKKVVTGDALVSILTQSVTSMNNKLNNRPCISIDPGTGHFIINEVDSGVKAVGEDGTAFTQITMDAANNVIGTLSDGTTVNLGNLSINIQGDFLTNGGFGNIRYYNGKFQYNNSGTWTDIATTNNDLLLGITPSPMKRIKVKYDETLGKNTLILIPPNDTIIDGQTLCFVEKVVVRRKKDSIPDSIADGEEVLTLNRSDFENYQKVPYVDQNCAVSKDDIWYYRAFPMSTLGLINTLEDTNVCDTSGTIIYGFTIDQNESDPSSMITYIEQNRYYDSAYMDYSLAKFNYGDWEDAWFIKDLKPCMLNYDGTVAYELDPNDYTKKITGEASDIGDMNFEGNAMMGIPKVYYKIVDNGDDTADVYFSNKKVDNDYHCWSHLDNGGNEIDYCYIPIYNGCLDSNNRLRSLSGKTPISSKTGQQEITYAQANNVNGDNIWYTELWCDVTLLNLLLLLIGKSTNTQLVFGNGNVNSSYPYLNTGLLNTKGLFYGTSDQESSVKVFGIENYWGNYYRRIGGLISDKTTYKIKLTYGQSDGSTVDGYNTDGTGYVLGKKTHITNSNAIYITECSFNNDCILPVSGNNGSSSTYYCDQACLSNGTNLYAAISSDWGRTLGTGVFFVAFHIPFTTAVRYVGASVSCKPLASTQNS